MLLFDQLKPGDKRLRALAVLVLAGLSVLVVGLWFVQVVSTRRYQASLANQTFRTVRVPATRGRILDRNGLVVAENRPSYNLDLYLEELRPLFDREFTRARGGRRLNRTERELLRAQVRYLVVSNTLQQLSRFLGEPVALSERDFRRHHGQWPYRPLSVRRNLPANQVAQFLEQAPGIPGLDLEIQPLRFYPLGPVVTHVVGHLSRDNLARDEEEGGFSYSLPTYSGEVGIERAFDRELSGSPGVKSVVVDSLSYRVDNLSYRQSEVMWTTAQAGHTVVLTLDLPLQKAADDALRAAGAQVRGAVVVLDAANGDVLALVSSPSYDANEFVTGISAERWPVLNDPKLRPQFNRATQGAYNPGSAFKIITMLACLEAGLDPAELYAVEPDKENPGKGCVWVGRRKIKDTAPPGDYDLVRAFKRSSNSYFIHHGLRAGRDRLLELGRRFHLGERTGLPTRQEVSGYFPRPEEVRGLWNDGNTANLCIGQEITVTPLGMAVLVAAVANGGHVFYPRLVSRVEPAEPGLEESTTNYFAPRLRGELGVPAAHLELVRQAMLADTEEKEGTGYTAFHEADKTTPRLKGFRVGGKTGTAEVKEGRVVVDHVTWFVAFGPGDQPRYAVVVVVESGGSGGGTCAPVACRVFQAIQQRIAPARPPAPTLTKND
jgi:penicillin-binding protein 2